MTEFETILVTQPDLDATLTKALTDKLSGICSKPGSHMLVLRDWGVRKLAYEINKQRRGHYHYLSYLGDGRLVTEVERNLRFDEKVIRFMTVKVGPVEDVQARLEAAKTQKEGSAPMEEVQQTHSHGGYHDDMGGSDDEMSH